MGDRPVRGCVRLPDGWRQASTSHTAASPARLPRRLHSRARWLVHLASDPGRSATTARRSSPEPALQPARAEVSFLGHECRRWSVKHARRLGPAQKTHVYTADLIVAELDIARTRALVGFR